MAITKQQALTLDTFHAAHHANATKCAIYRRNGMTQTWITRPNDFRVPVKFGMYTYNNITHNEAHLVYAPNDCPICHGTKR